MSSPRVPIFETISGAWIDAVRAVRAMPLVAGCALGINAMIAVGVFFAVDAILLNSGRTVLQWIASPAWFVFSVFNGIVQIILLAPLTIAVHRYIIRSEAATSYPLHPLRPSYLRYVGTALALFLAYRAPDLISLLLSPARTLPLALNVGIFILTAVLMLAVVIVALRRIALLAAIAAYAPNATWRTFAPASAGNVLRIMLVMIGVLAPGAVVGALLHAYLPTPNWPNGMGTLVLSFAMVLVQLPMLCAFAAAVARIYLAIGTSAVPARASGAGDPAIA